ncbi:MAG: lipase [Chitinophagaceae bacterium]|nr:MAG: lipase [Chitinophagaceae bacterium]
MSLIKHARRIPAAAAALISGAIVMAVTALGSVAPAVTLAVVGLTASPGAQALTCSSSNALRCTSYTENQFAGGFSFSEGYGGFGGASNCSVTHTPVVFIQGNADNAASWAASTYQVSGYNKPAASTYQAFKNAGYKDCELFGVNYLDSSERNSSVAQYNYHKESKYQIIADFISAVKSYTGASKVDIVSHSMGVTMTIAALDYYGEWGSVRRFVNIAGGLHGLDSCLWVGYGNPYAPTCGSQNWYDGWIFGFYPDSAYPGINPWTADHSTWYSLPSAAYENSGVRFYTIDGGTHDEVMCATTSDYSTCGNSPLFRSASNVISQLNVGAGSDTQAVNWDWANNGYPAYPNVYGGDSNGVGHFHEKNNTGSIVVEMLTTSCSGIGCASTYQNDNYGPVSAQ